MSNLLYPSTLATCALILCSEHSRTAREALHRDGFLSPTGKVWGRPAEASLAPSLSWYLPLSKEREGPLFARATKACFSSLARSTELSSASLHRLLSHRGPCLWGRCHNPEHLWCVCCVARGRRKHLFLCNVSACVFRPHVRLTFYTRWE